MKRPSKFLSGVITGLIVCLFLLCGHGDPPASAQSHPPLPTLQREKMAVMPFLKARYGADITQVLECPLCQISFDPDSLTPDCDKVLTRYVEEGLMRWHEEATIPLDKVLAIYEKMPKDEQKDTPLTLARSLGRRLGADFVFVGTVWKFKERKGGPRAVESPASVAFALYLVEVSTGKLRWQKSYAETQRSLSENILNARAFFEKGAKWLTANELARYGVNGILKTLPF